MKLQSTVWKDRTIHLPDASNTYFDQEGICEIDVDQSTAEYLVKNIQNLSIVNGTENAVKVTKEDVIDGVADIANQATLDANKKALADAALRGEAEVEKELAIKKINAIKSIKKLKDLASSFNKKEWMSLSTIEDLKTFLISKV